MLDIKYIIENKEYVLEGLKKKGFHVDVDALIALYLEINKLKTSSQSLAEEKNKLSNSIKSASPEDRPAIIARSKALGEQLKQEQEDLEAKQKEYDNMMLRMPNLPSPDAPQGEDESGNVVVRKVGKIPTFDFPVRDHIELMDLNDWSEMDRISKVCGSRT